MIKAIEANEKAKAFAVKTIEDNKARAVEWVETKVAPEIVAKAEKGEHCVRVACPTGVEWVYARDHLRSNGYNTEHYSGDYYHIKW